MKLCALTLACLLAAPMATRAETSTLVGKENRSPTGPDGLTVTLYLANFHPGMFTTTQGSEAGKDPAYLDTSGILGTLDGTDYVVGTLGDAVAVSEYLAAPRFEMSLNNGVDATTSGVNLSGLPGKEKHLDAMTFGGRILDAGASTPSALDGLIQAQSWGRPHTITIDADTIAEPRHEPSDALITGSHGDILGLDLGASQPLPIAAMADKPWHPLPPLPWPLM